MFRLTIKKIMALLRHAQQTLVREEGPRSCQTMPAAAVSLEKIMRKSNKEELLHTVCTPSPVCTRPNFHVPLNHGLFKQLRNFVSDRRQMRTSAK